MVLRKRMGSEKHQRRRPEIQRQPDHPQIRYRDREQNQSCHPGSLRGRGSQTERKRKNRTCPLHPQNTSQGRRPGTPFINANSGTAPGIVDADRQPILDRSEVYSGVYGRASINMYAFNSNGNKGIACGLNNLQKIRDGEPLGGKSRAEDDFATEEDDDFLN